MDKEEKIKIASVKSYKKTQKGNIQLQNGEYFKVEQIPFSKHTVIFNQLSKKYPEINKRALIFTLGKDDAVLRTYAELALPVFVKKPKVTAVEQKDSIGVDTMGYIDIQNLVTASILGVNAPKELMESFRERQPDIDKIMDELSSIPSETE